MDRAQLADFLRKRRESLQPEDVGLPRGSRRRTSGLRREEVAALCLMSTDYYGRLEQQRGPQPSEQMLTSIARGLRLSLDERDHLFRIAGHNAPVRSTRGDHVSPGLQRVVDRLADTPVQVRNVLGEVLMQTPTAVAMFGDETRFEGFARAPVYRWFTEPASRDIYPAEDHVLRGRFFVAGLRRAYSQLGARSRAGQMVDDLLQRSDEFARVWAEHEIHVETPGPKRFVHPEVGAIDLHCQVLVDPDQSQTLLVYTASPGTESHEKLQLLAVIGAQQLS